MIIVQQFVLDVPDLWHQAELTGWSATWRPAQRRDSLCANGQLLCMKVRTIRARVDLSAGRFV